MTIGRLVLSVIETGKTRYGWKQWILRYGGALPDALLWVPRDMDADTFLEFCRDLSDHGTEE